MEDQPLEMVPVEKDPPGFAAAGRSQQYAYPPQQPSAQMMQRPGGQIYQGQPVMMQPPLYVASAYQSSPASPAEPESYEPLMIALIVCTILGICWGLLGAIPGVVIGVILLKQEPRQSQRKLVVCLLAVNIVIVVLALIMAVIILSVVFATLGR